MPIALMVCSALIEIIGFWDAEIMANHAAWTVGRIAMVRGMDGMAFGGTGVTGTGAVKRGMPDGLSSALDGIYPGGSEKLADRGKIATVFLMSTCGIGYFGQTPKDADAGKFGTLVAQAYGVFSKNYEKHFGEAAMSFMKDILASVKSEVQSKVGGSSSLFGILLGSIVFDAILNPILEEVLTPVFGKLSTLAGSALETLAHAQDLKPVSTAFSSGVLPSRQRRQLYGAALRMERNENAVRVTDTVSLLTDTAKKFLFSNENPLGHPLVADGRAKTNGYFVTSAAGWPPENKAHRLLRIDVRWPYEAGWVFPVLSGNGTASAAPAAVGHSMVFPQPNLRNANLYSTGAAPFDGPNYNPDEEGAADALLADMTNYLAAARFCMQFRICEEQLAHWDHGCPGCGLRWHYCPQLVQVFGLRQPNWHSDWTTNHVPCYQGDYFQSWTNLTRVDEAFLRRCQDYYAQYYHYTYTSYHPSLWRTNLNEYASQQYNQWGSGDVRGWSYTDPGYRNRRLLDWIFMPWSYHNRDYFHWDGWFHKGYQWELCRNKGDLPGGRQWGESDNAPYCHKDDTSDVFNRRYHWQPFDFLENAWREKAGLQWWDKSATNEVISLEDLRGKLKAFAERNQVNIPHLCAWQTPGAFERWKEDDQSILEKAIQISGDDGFPRIMALVHDEAEEIKKMLEGDGEDVLGPLSGNVFDPNSLDVMDTEGSALDKARGNWEEIKGKLRQCLHELEDIVVELRTLYAGWTDEDGTKHPGLDERLASCLNDRRNATLEGFALACLEIVFETRDPTILDAGSEERFFAAFRASERDETGGRLGYPIALRTAELRKLVERYEELAAAAFDKEIEYGKLLGLKSGNKYTLPDGMSFDDSLSAADKPEFTDQTGTLTAGNDHGDLIDKDKQEYGEGGWEWK